MCVSESEWVRVDALKTVKENASDGVERVRSGSAIACFSVTPTTCCYPLPTSDPARD